MKKIRVIAMILIIAMIIPMIPAKSKAVSVEVQIEWTQDGPRPRFTFDGTGALGYRIYRSESPGDLGISVTDFMIEETEFIDMNVESGITYYYTLKEVITEARPFDGVPEQEGQVLAKWEFQLGTETTRTTTETQPQTPAYQWQSGKYQDANQKRYIYDITVSGSEVVGKYYYQDGKYRGELKGKVNGSKLDLTWSHTVGGTFSGKQEFYYENGKMYQKAWDSGGAFDYQCELIPYTGSLAQSTPKVDGSWLQGNWQDAKYKNEDVYSLKVDGDKVTGVFYHSYMGSGYEGHNHTSSVDGTFSKDGKSAVCKIDRKVDSRGNGTANKITFDYEDGKIKYYRDHGSYVVSGELIPFDGTVGYQTPKEPETSGKWTGAYWGSIKSQLQDKSGKDKGLRYMMAQKGDLVYIVYDNSLYTVNDWAGAGRVQADGSIRGVHSGEWEKMNNNGQLFIVVETGDGIIFAQSCAKADNQGDFDILTKFDAAPVDNGGNKLFQVLKGGNKPVGEDDFQKAKNYYGNSPQLGLDPKAPSDLSWLNGKWADERNNGKGGTGYDIKVNGSTFSGKLYTASNSAIGSVEEADVVRDISGRMLHPRVAVVEYTKPYYGKETPFRTYFINYGDSIETFSLFKKGQEYVKISGGGADDVLKPYAGEFPDGADSKKPATEVVIGEPVANNPTVIKPTEGTQKDESLVQNGVTGVAVKVQPTGAKGYRWYRSEKEGELGESLTKDILPTPNFVDVNAKPGVGYWYTIKEIISQGPPEKEGKTLLKWFAKTSKDLGKGTVNPKNKKHYIQLTMGSPKMFVDGVEKEIDPGRNTKPENINGRILVPIRAIVESMGGKVGWDNGQKLVRLNANGQKVEMVLNAKNFKVNSQSKKIDVAPKVINGRTMVPIRFSSENLKCQVDWLKSSKQVVIVWSE